MITLDVQFSHSPDLVPFTALPDDVETHGRELFERAVSGDFGEIEEYTPPTELEIATEVNPGRRLQQMALCTSKVQHWEMMGEFQLADEWRLYYRALAALESAESWPVVEAWPTAPAE